MKGGLIVVGIIVVVAVMLSGQLMRSRNQLVIDKNDIDARWAQVESDVKQQANLIPNLVATVQGYVTQEQPVISTVTNAHTALLRARTKEDAINVSNQLSVALGRLRILAESYPQLKSNKAFLDLQNKLVDKEKRIAVDRHDYNEALDKYNTDLKHFPHNVVASLLGFRPDDAYFKATEEEKKVPQVRF